MLVSATANGCKHEAQAFATTYLASGLSHATNRDKQYCKPTPRMYMQSTAP